MKRIKNKQLLPLSTVIYRMRNILQIVFLSAIQKRVDGIVRI